MQSFFVFLNSTSMRIFGKTQLLAALLIYFYFAWSSSPVQVNAYPDWLMHFIGNCFLYGSFWWAFFYKRVSLLLLFLLLPFSLAVEFAQAILLHVPKDQSSEIFQKLAAKVKPGGYLYVSVKQIEADGLAEKVVVDEHTYRTRIERFFSFFTAEEVRRLFEAYGFTIVFDELRPSGRGTWINIIGQKPR